MSSQRDEITICVREHLARIADDAFAESGFSRPQNSLVYSRRIREARQSIDVAVEHHPMEEPNAAAVVNPYYTISIPEVNKFADKLVDSDSRLGGNLKWTLHAPIRCAAPKGNPARWYLYQPASVQQVVCTFREYILRWVIPFLGIYVDTESICNAPYEGDGRVVHTEAELLRVVAARALTGRAQDAIALMELRFGRPGSRKRYARAFDRLRDLAQNPE